MHDLDLPWNEPVQLAPGVLCARRGFFATVAAACTAAALPGSSARWRDRTDAHDWSVEEFVREVTPICKELVADTSAIGQDRYLHALAAQAVRLTTVPVPECREVAPGHRIGANHGPDPFTVLHWILAPNCRIRPHPHIYGNVVTLGLTGGCRVHNYEVIGKRDYDSKEPFTVVRTVDQWLRPGDINLVSLERHHVHGFTAGPEGASGLDITTRIAEKRKSPTLEVGEVVDAVAGTFTGRWHYDE